MTESKPPAPPLRTKRPVIPLQVQDEAPGAGATVRWLLAAPHRLFFFLGMLALAVVSLWWLAQLVSRAAGAPLPLAVPPSWLHGWSMANGFLPLFMFGFLFTAGPRWLNADGPPARPLALPGVLAACGVPLGLIGAQFAGSLVAAGAVLVAAGWLVLLARFLRLFRSSRNPDRIHARLVLVFFGFGWLAHLAFAIGIASLSAPWVHSAQMLSIWLFIAPVYVTVAHRLIPFFTASVVPFLDAWRPLWLLAAFIIIVVAHGLLPLGSVFVPATTFGVLRLAVDALGAALLFFVAWRWGVVQSLRIRLLAMLHLGFFWLGIALALYAWNQAMLLLGLPQAGLGLAPLHALTMGFFGGVAFAMVTRVTAGHSGRQLLADNITWTLFWILQAAVLVRLLSEAWPAQGHWLAPLAIALWCAALLPWVVRNALIYVRPRADGRPG
jgi:uncharacterized protein involved in response to NO